MDNHEDNTTGSSADSGLNLGVLDQLVGVSDTISNIRTLARQVAGTRISILISGDSGTGKEVVARLIHDLSPRREASFVPVNCGAIPEGLFESEVFGHERGSFTGADRLRKGYFEQAHGGTLLLDEVGEMPLSMQVKVLRALESGEYYRVGGSRSLKSDVRILAATNRDLAGEVERGNFRQDLYFRLKAVEIHLTPLSKRPEDIPPLAERFVAEFCRENHIPRPRFLREAMEAIQSHEWKGNARELRHFLGTLLTLEEGPIGADAVYRQLPHGGSVSSNLPVLAPVQRDGLNNELIMQLLLDLRRDLQELKEMVAQAILITRYPTALPEKAIFHEDDEGYEHPSLEEIEREQIRQVLKEKGGNRRKAARALGIGERTLYRKIKEYNL